MGELDEDDLTDKLDEKIWGDDEDKDEVRLRIEPKFGYP